MAKIIPITRKEVSGDVAFGAPCDGARHVKTRARPSASPGTMKSRSGGSASLASLEALLADPFVSFLKADAPEAMTRGAIGRPFDPDRARPP